MTILIKDGFWEPKTLDGFLPKRESVNEALGSMVRTRFRSRMRRGNGRYKRKKTLMGSRKAGRAAVGRTITTVQRDYSKQYIRRPVSGKKRRMWKKFVKKVEAAGDKNLGLQTTLQNYSESISLTDASQQKYGSLALYSRVSSDLAKVAATLDQQPGLDVNSRIDDTTRLMFRTGLIDITMRNTSYKKESVNSPESAYGECSLEVDIYTIKASKLFRKTNVIYVSIEEVINSGFSLQKEIGTGQSGMTLSNRGVTPFEAPQAIKDYGLKIMKKVKYFIPWGGQMTWQLRDPLNRNLNVGKMKDPNLGGNYIGSTTHFLIVMKPVTGISLSDLNVARLTVGVTKKYAFKVEGRTTVQESLLSHP